MPSFASNFQGPLVKLRARNSALPTTESNLNALNTILVVQSVQLAGGAKLDITSSSASDASAGTGARTIEIYGLAPDYTFQSEILTLNGNTIVQSAKSYIRVFEIAVITAGSGLTNVGDIYVVKTGTGGTYTAGIPGTLTSAFIKAIAGDNFGLSGLWTTPAGTTYSLISLALSSRGQAGTVKLKHGYFDNGLTYPQLKIDFTPADPVAVSYPVPLITIGEKEDFYFTGLAATAGAFVSCEAIFVKQGS